MLNTAVLWNVSVFFIIVKSQRMYAECNRNRSFVSKQKNHKQHSFIFYYNWCYLNFIKHTKYTENFTLKFYLQIYRLSIKVVRQID